MPLPPPLDSSRPAALRPRAVRRRAVRARRDATPDARPPGPRVPRGARRGPRRCCAPSGGCGRPTPSRCPRRARPGWRPGWRTCSSRGTSPSSQRPATSAGVSPRWRNGSARAWCGSARPTARRSTPETLLDASTAIRRRASSRSSTRRPRRGSSSRCAPWPPRCRRTAPLLMADCVTSLGGVPLDVGAWGVDYAYSCTQKCLAAPPGMAPVAVSPRAWERIAARRTPPPVLARPRATARLLARAAGDLPPHGADPGGLRAARGAPARARGGPGGALGAPRGGGRATSARRSPAAASSCSPRREVRLDAAHGGARAGGRRRQGRPARAARGARHRGRRGARPGRAADLADRAHGAQRDDRRGRARARRRSTTVLEPAPLAVA